MSELISKLLLIKTFEPNGEVGPAHPIEINRNITV